ncbi:MAG: GNAT family N-acetyltransferase [Mucilaginibacter sp.]|uniref:GNAT family N-acetyltransferase n=1 Tax=Mucilaginibacter sp. TaxID=1882438 RepID=UPI003266192D
MLNLEISTFPVLNTERLVLRRLVPEYAIELHQLRSDPEINLYLDRDPSTDIADAVAFINKIKTFMEAHQSMYWVLTLAGDNNPLIGTICFWNFDKINDTIELGYELMPAYQGKGLMAEAVTCVIQYGFEQMNARAITAFPSADNVRSIALLNKFGFIIDDELQTTLHNDVDQMLAFSLKR